MKPQAPCKDCEKRKLLCHSVCPEYKTFKDEVERFNEANMKHGRKEDNAMPMMLYLSTNGNQVFTAGWQLWVLAAILLIGIIMFVIIIRKT